MFSEVVKIAETGSIGQQKSNLGLRGSRVGVFGGEIFMLTTSSSQSRLWKYVKEIEPSRHHLPLISLCLFFRFDSRGKFDGEKLLRDGR